MGGGSGGGNQTTTTTASIPDELKPLALAYTNKAIDLGNQTYTPYTGQRYASLTGDQNAAIGLMENNAANSAGTNYNANNTLNGMVSGGVSNPYLDQSVQTAMNAVKGQVQSQFGGSNYGTTANQEQLTRNLGDTANNMYSANYQADQTRQLQAIQQAQANNSSNVSNLMNAGQTQQQQNQNNLDVGYQNYQDQLNLPYKQLAAMSGVFGSNLGSSSTSTTTGNNSGGK